MDEKVKVLLNKTDSIQDNTTDPETKNQEEIIDEQFDNNPDSETLDFSIEGSEDALNISDVFTLHTELDNNKSRIELINDLRHAARHRLVFSVRLIGADYKRINDKQVLCMIAKLDPPYDGFEVYITFDSFFTEYEKIRFNLYEFPDDAKRRRMMEYFGATVEICISRLSHARLKDELLILGSRSLAMRRLYTKFYEKGVWVGRGYGQHKIKVRKNSVVQGCRVIRQKADFIDVDICGIPYTIYTQDLSWKYVISSMEVCEVGDLIDVRITDIRWMVMAKNDKGDYKQFDITQKIQNAKSDEEIEKIEQIDEDGFKSIMLNEFNTYRFRVVVASVKEVVPDYTLPVLEEYSKPEKLGYPGETLATVVGMNRKTGRVRMYCEIGYNAVAKFISNPEIELPGNVSDRARRRRDVIPGSKVIFRPYRRSSLGDFMEGDITRVIKR